MDGKSFIKKDDASFVAAITARKEGNEGVKLKVFSTLCKSNRDIILRPSVSQGNLFYFH